MIVSPAEPQAPAAAGLASAGDAHVSELAGIEADGALSATARLACLRLRALSLTCPPTEGTLPRRKRRPSSNPPLRNTNPKPTSSAWGEGHVYEAARVVASRSGPAYAAPPRLADGPHPT